jgi:hypothetical protein
MVTTAEKIYCDVPPAAAKLEVVPERQQQQIRVTEEQAKRLRRVAKGQGLTIQAFALRAIMAAVAEVEEELRADKERKQRVERDEEAAILSMPNVPQGLGIRARREKKEAAEKADRAANVARSPAPSIIINSSGAAATLSAHEAAVAELAARVASAPGWRRGMELKHAVGTLQRLADTDEERQALARRLDELVADADRKPRQRQSKGALDQLWDLLGG